MNGKVIGLRQEQLTEGETNGLKFVKGRQEYLCALWCAADHNPELNLSLHQFPLKYQRSFAASHCKK